MKEILVTVGALFALLGTAFGSVWFLDARYAPMAALENVEWSLLKEQIRTLRRELEASPGDQDLQDELDELIDRLCKSFPDDRECKD